jgi:uncharacterized membrane protein HdeD (DUF308 family)
MEKTYRGEVRSAANWSIALSILMMVTGGIAVFAPGITGIAVTLMFGWLLMFSSVLHLVYAWYAERPGGAIWEILLAVFYAAIGVYLLTKPVLGLEALTLALALYLVAASAVEFIMAYELRPLAGSGWLVFDGIVTLLMSALIASGWPASSTFAIGTIVAVSMFFSGFTRLMMSIAVKQVVA